MSKKKKINLNNPNIQQGTFKRNEKGFGFVKINDLDEIYIPSKFTMHAFDEDVVIIRTSDKKENSKKQEGKILEIIKHSRTSIIGTFKKSKNFGFLIPDDRKVSEDIFIPKKNFSKAKNNQKVEVEITKFPDKDHKAEGKVVEILGNIDEAGIDILSLVKEYRLPYEFPEKVVNEAKKVKRKMEEEEIKNRYDFRNEEIFTIDGEDAKDLDDAVNVKKNEDGTYELGVYIADVSNYVRAGSELDKEARIRGTSVYLMDRVIPMIPKELSNGICSLNEGVDRFVLSIIMKIDRNGKVIDSDIKKGVIKVTKRMTYSKIKKILDYEDYINGKDLQIDKEELKELENVYEEYKEYKNHFIRMRELKDILKNRREKDGSLNLDIPESKITLNEDGIAVKIEKYDYSESNEIIEQFMLTANESVAEKFYWIQAPFIYRVHEVPDIDKINDLNKFLFNLGYKIKGVKKDEPESVHPKAFAEVLEKIKGKPEERVISNLILRTLKVARYENENKGHFGIASKCYCHFTSPIRRYPDLFIHRVISDYLKYEYNISEKLKEKYEEQSKEYAEISSEREKIAQKVERDAENIKKAEFMQEKVGEVYEGIVSNITPFGMFVELENTVEGLIRFENMGDEYYVYNDEKKTLIGEHTKRIFKIGDSVEIRVIGADKITRKIDFELNTY